jgi:hypothetical protein
MATFKVIKDVAICGEPFEVVQRTDFPDNHTYLRVKGGEDEFLYNSGQVGPFYYEGRRTVHLVKGGERRMSLLLYYARRIRRDFRRG